MWLKLNPYCLLCDLKCFFGTYLFHKAQWISPHLTAAVACSLANEFKQSE